LWAVLAAVGVEILEGSVLMSMVATAATAAAVGMRRRRWRTRRLIAAVVGLTSASQ
jgi:hypothetical protein